MTVADAAEYFGVSKEAIHNRIRRGSLECIVENGIKYVAVTSTKSGTGEANDSRYTQYIEQENGRLRERVDILEKETTRLRDQREQMLIDERINVEQIYKERDAQLRNILNVVATKFLSHVSPDAVYAEAMGGAEVINADLIEGDDWISLKSFLKLKNYNEKVKEKIKKQFKKSRNDSRITVRDGKIFLNPSRFDYTDLLTF